MKLIDFFHVLNPSARQKDTVQNFFDKNKSLQCIWVERHSHPTHLETILNWAYVEGHRRLGIWGGDGTLNRAIQYLYEQNLLTKVEIALFPAGTCNDFFRKLKSFPLQKQIFFDLGILESGPHKRVFLNNAGFGRTPSALAKKKSNPIRDIFSLTEKQVQIEWEDSGKLHVEECGVLLGVVCNSPYFNCGLHFSKKVEPNDGKLNGFFETSQNKLKLLMKFVQGRRGRILADHHTVGKTSSWIKITAQNELYPQVDGEPAFDFPVTSLTFSIIPQAVKFLFSDKAN